MRRVVIGAATAALAAFAIAAGGAWLFFASMQHTRFESSGPVGTMTAGTITVDDAAERLTITSADIGTSLYHLNLDYVYSAPDFSDAGGHLHINRSSNVVNFWGRPRDVIDLTVNRSVLWTVVINGAGSTTSLDLSDGRLGSLTVSGAANNVALSAGAPHGVVAVSLSGVASALTLHLPTAAEYRATADGIGASVAGTIQTDGWSTAQDRYDVTINGVGVHATITNEAVP